MEQRERPKTMPGGMEENLTVVMMRVRRSVRTALREAVGDAGLTQNEIEVLLFLQRGTFDTARDISRVRGMPRSLVSKAVDQLVKRGFVEACQDKQDRRVVRLRLLPPAQAIVEKLVETRKEFFAQLCRDITREEAAAFYAMVEKMTKNLSEMKNLSEQITEEEKEERL